MDETLEVEDAPVLEKQEAAAVPAESEPKAYMFDGWGLVPLEL